MPANGRCFAPESDLDQGEGFERVDYLLQVLFLDEYVIVERLDWIASEDGVEF